MLTFLVFPVFDDAERVLLFLKAFSNPSHWASAPDRGQGSLIVGWAGMIFLSCLLAFSVNLSTFLVIGRTSPVSYQVTIDMLDTLLRLWTVSGAARLPVLYRWRRMPKASAQGVCIASSQARAMKKYNTRVSHSRPNCKIVLAVLAASDGCWATRVLPANLTPYQ